MRLVVQRVKKAEVTLRQGFDDELSRIAQGKGDLVVGKIDRGLFVLVGVRQGDTKKDAEVLAGKLAKLRIMSDEKGKMNLSVKDLPAQAGVDGEILVVSQFTLYADTSGGNRPSFIQAAEPKLAEEIYERFIAKLKDLGVKVQTGKFGEYMQISTELDGPVTIIL